METQRTEIVAELADDDIRRVDDGVLHRHRRFPYVRSVARQPVVVWVVPIRPVDGVGTDEASVDGRSRGNYLHHGTRFVNETDRPVDLRVVGNVPEGQRLEVRHGGHCQHGTRAGVHHNAPARTRAILPDAPLERILGLELDVVVNRQVHVRAGNRIN